MTRNWIAVNIVLIIIAGLLGWRLHASIKLFKAENNLAKIQPARDPKQKIALESGMPPLQPLPQYNVADFGIIPAQNLFSDTRTKEEKVEAAPAVPEVPALVVRPILVGVTLVNDQKMASVIDPTAAGGGRKSQTRRLGDTYQGYTITDITPDQMVLERGSRREVIPLFDSGKHPAQGAPAQSGKTPILPTRVIAFAGGSSGQGVAQPVVGGARTVAAGSPSAASGQASQGGAQSSANRNAPAAQGRQVPGAQQPATAQPAGGPVDQQGRRVIRTPFGDIPAPPTP
jgi:hypothetical protein